MELGNGVYLRKNERVKKAAAKVFVSTLHKKNPNVDVVYVDSRNVTVTCRIHGIVAKNLQASTVLRRKCVCYECNM